MKAKVKRSTRGVKASIKTRAASRTKVMQAALKALRTEGFAGTSARAIGRVGGFPPGLIYYYFDSLEALLLGAIDMTSSARLARYRDVLAPRRTQSRKPSKSHRRSIGRMSSRVMWRRFKS